MLFIFALYLSFTLMEDSTYLAGAALSGTASMFNTAVQYAQNKTDKKFTREMFDKQTQVNRENWEMTNEYNKPINQMKRFAEAGLNPHLIYGQGTVAQQPSSSSTPSWHQQAPQFNPEALMVYYQLKQADLQNKSITEDIYNKQADWRLKEKDLALKDKEIFLRDMQGKREEWQLSFDQSVADLNKALLSGKINLINEQVTQVKSQVANANSITESQLLTMAQARTEQIRMNNVTVQEIGAKIRQGYMQAQAALKQAQAALTNAATNSKMYQLREKEYQLAKDKWDTMQKYYGGLINKTDAEIGSIYQDILNKAQHRDYVELEKVFKQNAIYLQGMQIYRESQGRGTGSHIVDEAGAITDVIMSAGGFLFGF